MKVLRFFLIIFLLCSPSMLKAEEVDKRNKITKNLRCLVCQGQSIYDSDTDFAISVKLLVKKKLDEGLNEKQVYSYLKDRYGEWILFDPLFSKKTYFLWLLPIFMFVIGGMIIFKLFIIRKN